MECDSIGGVTLPADEAAAVLRVCRAQAEGRLLRAGAVPPQFGRAMVRMAAAAGPAVQAEEGDVAETLRSRASGLPRPQPLEPHATLQRAALEALQAGPATWGELQQRLGAHRNSLSRALRGLREKGLAVRLADGRWVARSEWDDEEADHE